MKYALQVKFVEFGGRVVEKELPMNNTRVGNYLFDLHKSYPDTLSVLLRDSDSNTLRKWVRT